VADHLCPSITYQWTKNNITVTQLETPPNSLSFSPLRLSDIGEYSCQATVRALALINNVAMMGIYVLTLQSKSSLVCEIAV
jgi:hypothetical protein